MYELFDAVQKGEIIANLDITRPDPAIRTAKSHRTQTQRCNYATIVSPIQGGEEDQGFSNIGRQIDVLVLMP